MHIGPPFGGRDQVVETLALLEERRRIVIAPHDHGGPPHAGVADACKGVAAVFRQTGQELLGFQFLFFLVIFFPWIRSTRWFLTKSRKT